MNLNLNEQLLRDTKDAHICIFIANLAGWLRTNIDREKFEQRNVHDGKCWSYSTIKDFQNYFDFWSIKNIRTIIKHCEQQGLIELGNYNKHKYDRTSWYTLTNKALEYYPILRDKIRSRITDNPVNTDLSETAKVFVANGKPIPEDLYSLSNINITNSALAATRTKKAPSIELMELINIYREVFPDNPQPHKRVIATSLQKTLGTLVKRWPELDPEGKPISLIAFRKYMESLKVFAPRFSLGEYTTTDGNRKKNGLETFARWNTIVKFLENAYS